MKKRCFLRALCVLLALFLLAAATGCTPKLATSGGGSAEGQMPPNHTLPPLPNAAAQASPAEKEPGDNPPAQQSPQEKPPADGGNAKPVHYTHPSGAFSIDLPAGFVTDDETEMSVNASGTNGALLFVLYAPVGLDIPLYSCDDVGDNKAYITEALWGRMGVPSHTIDNASYTDVAGQRAYRIDSTLEADGVRLPGVIIGVDAPGWGCYLLMGSCSVDSADIPAAAQELETVIASFRCTGAPDLGLALFESDELGLRAMYPTATCRGGTEIEYNQQDIGLVDCAYFYSHQNRAIMNYVEAERATYGSTPQRAMDALDKKMKTLDLLEKSTQEEGTIDNRTYLVRTYSALTDGGGKVYITMTTMEIDGTVIAVGGIANEDGFDDTKDILTTVLRTIQPYDLEQNLL